MVEEKKGYGQESTQLNNQDLDQVQYNTQQLNISMSERTNGKIVGMAYLYEEKRLLKGVELRLYFGDISKKPLKRIWTLEDGSYEFSDLPTGFYSIVAQYKKREYIFQYIQLDIGETLHKPIPID